MDDPAQLSEYGKILIILLIGALLVCATIFLARLISPKKNNPIKSGTYECGEDPIGSSWVQFNPRFYVIALVFLLFDVDPVPSVISNDVKEVCSMRGSLNMKLVAR